VRCPSASRFSPYGQKRTLPESNIGIEGVAMSTKSRLQRGRNTLTVLAVLGAQLIAVSPVDAVSTITIDLDPPDHPAVTVHIPTAYDPGVVTPLVIMLHAYTWDGQGSEDVVWQLLPHIDTYGFIYAFPDGRTDLNSLQYWEANDWSYLGEGPADADSVYLKGLIDEIKNQLNVDPTRVFIIGRSNGGAMANRMACDHSGTIAAAVSLAGPGYYDETLCTPSLPVHFLHIHGTRDSVVSINGGILPDNNEPYPGAEETVLDWAAYNGCSAVADTSQANFDFANPPPAIETSPIRYPTGCHIPGSAELWSANNTAHRPSITAVGRARLLDFLFAHPKQWIGFEADDVTLSWPAVEVASSYNVYRGFISDLSDGDDDGIPDNGYGLCLDEGSPGDEDTVLVDTDVPDPGTGFFYVLSYDDIAQDTEGGIGRTSAGIVRPVFDPCP